MAGCALAQWYPCVSWRPVRCSKSGSEACLADMTGHIVGVQFRECATFGGSVWGRFGFSDILTGLLALECEVELAEAGRIPLRDFAARKADRDILAAVWVRLDGRKAVYHTVRNAGTDFPVLACAVSRGEGETAYRLSIGAVP